MANKTEIPRELVERVDRARRQAIESAALPAAKMMTAKSIGRVLNEAQREEIGRIESRRLARFIGYKKNAASDGNRGGIENTQMSTNLAQSQKQINGTPAPLAVDAVGAAKLLDISPAHLFALKAKGEFGPCGVRLGRSVRYRVDELRAWLAAGCPSQTKWAAMQGAAR